MHGLCVYIWINLPVARENLLNHQMIVSRAFDIFYCTLFAISFSTISSLFLKTAAYQTTYLTIQKCHFLHSSANICVFGDFNAHHLKLLTHSDFSITHFISQTMDFCTRFPNNYDQRAALLELFFPLLLSLDEHQNSILLAIWLTLQYLLIYL